MMAIRVIKNEIRRLLRTEIKSKREYAELLVFYMNLMTCEQPHAEPFWSEVVNTLVSTKFFPPRSQPSSEEKNNTSNPNASGNVSNDDESLPFRMLDYGLHQGFLFLSLCQVMGIILLPKTFEVFQPQYHSAMHMCFGIFDIQEIRPTVKYLNYIDLATGMYVYHLCRESANASAVPSASGQDGLGKCRNNATSNLNSKSSVVPSYINGNNSQPFNFDPSSDNRLLSTYSQKSYYRFLCVSASWSNLSAKVLPENFFQFRKYVRELNRCLQQQFHSSKSLPTSLSSSAENGLSSNSSNASSFFRFNNKSGWLEKEGELLSIFKKRFFVIEANYGRISYYEYDDKTEKKGEIAIASIREVREAPAYQQTKFVFGIWTVQGRVYYLRCSDEDNVRRWLEAIQETVRDVNTFSSGNSGSAWRTHSTKL
jgi:hypothetical protein